MLLRVSKTEQWYNSFLLVLKPNSTVRLYIDPARLNHTLIRPIPHSPTMKDILQNLEGARYFRIIDAKSSYWNVMIIPNNFFMLICLFQIFKTSICNVPL